MQAVREVLLRGLKGFTVSTLIVDVECQTVISQAEAMERRGEAGSITSMLYTALMSLLQALKPRLSDYRSDVVINLNMSPLKYPLHFWEQLLFLAVRNSDFPWTVYITRITDADRAKYCETKKTLQSFRKSLDGGIPAAPDEADYDYETILKATLANSFTAFGVSEENIHGLLAQNHNLEDLLKTLKTLKKI